MNVTFVDYGPSLASSRLRAAIPQQELLKLGVKKGNDVVVYGKHWTDEAYLSQFGFRVYDICDDHFDNPACKSYYLKHAETADVVTCNSDIMQAIIWEKTGREAIVIPEPYESAEYLPEIGPRLLWFGHRSNIPDLMRIKPSMKYPLAILSNHEAFAEWSPRSFNELISYPCIVIIPTGKSQAKSENRMVESIRRGRYVCAEYLPAYRPFEKFFPLGDIKSGVDAALKDPQASLARIHAAQDYIRDRYSPKTIGEQWLKAINEHIHLR